MLDLDRIKGFDWDQGNASKSSAKHDVSSAEAEQIFFNDPLLTVVDSAHSDTEEQWHALGRTNADRLLHVTFTLRQDGTRIRIISVRDMSRKERVIYAYQT